MSQIDSLKECLPIIRALPWSASVAVLTSALEKAGFQPEGSSRPGVRMDFSWQSIPASLYLNGESASWLDLYFDLIEDKEDLDDAAYEQLLAEYHSRHERAVEIATALLGPPQFRGEAEDPGYPEEAPGGPTCMWSLAEGTSLRLEVRDDGPDVPTWLGLVVQRDS